MSYDVREELDEAEGQTQVAKQDTGAKIECRLMAETWVAEKCCDSIDKPGAGNEKERSTGWSSK